MAGTATAAAAAASWWLRHLISPSVRGWSPGSGRLAVVGPLRVRTLGDGGPATVLLHGLTGSGDGFGAGFDRLAKGGRLVVPDLLGFAGSMDLHRRDFSLEAHLDALDAVAAALELDDRPLTIAGHSMGAVLALHWAARRPTVQRVVSFCGPLYLNSEEARQRIGAMGLLESLFALESPLAAGTCALMCSYRRVAQWVSVAVSPEWPVHLARQGVLHTWPSYLGGMNGIIVNAGWTEALQRLENRRVPVVLADGATDPVPVRGRSAQLERQYLCVTSVAHPKAGHDLPVAYADWCATVLSAAG